MSRHRINVPQSAKVGVVLPPLADDQGHPFDHIPCADNPAAWDEDAAKDVKKASALVCVNDCPALTACTVRLYQVGLRATGVWAGKVLRPSGVGDSENDIVGNTRGFPRERDPLIVRWARQAGIDLPPGPQ